MASTNWTTEDLAALEDAIKKGVSEVQYQDRKIKYRSLSEMLQLRDVMKECLGLNKRRGRVFAKTDKGLGC